MTNRPDWLLFALVPFGIINTVFNFGWDWPGQLIFMMLIGSLLVVFFIITILYGTYLKLKDGTIKGTDVVQNGMIRTARPTILTMPIKVSTKLVLTDIAIIMIAIFSGHWILAIIAVALQVIRDILRDGITAFNFN